MKRGSTDEREIEELRKLISGLCDGELQPHEVAQLEKLVATSKVCCQYYITAMHINAALPRYSGADRRSISSRIAEQQIVTAASRPEWSEDESVPPLEQFVKSTPPAVPAMPDLPDADGLTGTAEGSSWSLFGWRSIWLLTLALFCTTFLAASAWLWFGDSPDRVAVIQEPIIERSHSRPDESLAVPSAYVARIVKASSDCTWGHLAAPGEFLLRCKAGSKLSVAVGLVELEFVDGARVILHGPAEFTPIGPASGRLDSGRLTGKVENGNFRLMTPAAEVIDLGTEFGVVADAKLGSDVVVFDGRVQVVSRSDRLDAKKTLDLTEGMAARFHLDGTTEYGPQTDVKQFQRTVGSNGVSAGGNEICLVDIVGGGDGLGKHLAGAINPLTGQKDYGEGRQPVSGCVVGDGLFHGCPWHPLIDGVFIPLGNGQEVQIDSAGRRTVLPPGHGMTWSCIWSRRHQSVYEPHNAEEDDFWGARTLRGIVEKLKLVRNGLVGIHANVGITLDLQAVRLLHRRWPTEFRGAVVNFEASREFNAEQVIIEKRTADLRILVDGNLRYSRLAFRREDGDAEFAVPLKPDDRFLTIISSDDGNYSWDQVLLIDPILVLPDPQQDSEEITRR
jgi:hypothetical protein